MEKTKEGLNERRKRRTGKKVLMGVLLVLGIVLIFYASASVLLVRFIEKHIELELEETEEIKEAKEVEPELEETEEIKEAKEVEPELEEIKEAEEGSKKLKEIKEEIELAEEENIKLIKINLHNMKALAEIYFESNDYSYYVSEDNNFCTPDESINFIYDPTKELGGDGDCFAGKNNWIVWVRLRPEEDVAWCVDSKGSSREINIVPRPILNENVSCESFAVSD